MNALAPLTKVRPEDPSELGYPATLPIELVLKTAPLERICEAYRLTREDLERLLADERFKADLKAAADMLKKEGMSFKMKARLQSEGLLQTAWKMIHADPEVIPPSVQADLLKFVVRVAGLDASKDQAAAAGGTALQININLGDK